MFSETIVVLLIGLGASAQYIPSTDDYIFHDLMPLLNLGGFLLDGPANVSYAPTTPTTNARPNLQQMMYYNYYSASMYCQYQLNDLSCTYCRKFKGDVYMWKGKHCYLSYKCAYGFDVAEMGKLFEGDCPRHFRQIGINPVQTPELNEQIVTNCFISIVLINSDADVTALITLSKTREEIVVTFRGTQNIFNAVLGATMFNVCYDNPNCDIRLHAGLYAATISIYNKIIMNVGYLLSLPLYQNYKLVITGHSLGGAVARITTFFILYLDQFPATEIALYTYGEVRVGNKGFVDFMNAQNITTARVTSRADVIPHFIPVSILGTTLLGDYYMHTQTEYWIDGSNNQKFADTSVYTDRSCSDSMGPAYSVLDHFQYFDANYLICYVNQPLVFLAIPASILQPIGTIPPLPKKISNFIGAAVGFVTWLLGGILG